MNYRSATIALCSIFTIFIMELDFFCLLSASRQTIFYFTVKANEKKKIKRYYQFGELWLRKCDFFFFNRASDAFAALFILKLESKLLNILFVSGGLCQLFADMLSMA